MKKSFFIIISLIFSCKVISQSAEDSVKRVVTKMFTAMKSANQKRLLDCFADSAILQTIAKKPRR